MKTFEITYIIKIRDKPVIVTAADRKYFHVLSAAVSFIHQNYPDYEFIIYDLGLTNEQLQMVKKKDLFFMNIRLIEADCLSRSRLNASV